MGMKLPPGVQARVEAMATPAAPKPPEAPAKYRNRKVEYKGVKFDSKLELRLWMELELLAGRNAISFLRRQVSYRIAVNGLKICHYRADYVFIFNGKPVVGDAKGMLTDVFRLKAKLMKAVFGIDVVTWKSLKAMREWFAAEGK